MYSAAADIAKERRDKIKEAETYAYHRHHEPTVFPEQDVFFSAMLSRNGRSTAMKSR